MSQSDLEAYAKSHGLPTSYVKHFISAVLNVHSGQQHDINNVNDAEVSFQAFSKFVRSREQALRRAFDLFDRGG